MRSWLVPALLAAVVVGAAAPAHAAAPATDTLVTDINSSDRAAALDYWTPERMSRTGADPTERPERVASPWAGQAPKGVGRLFVTQEPGRQAPTNDSWCTATAVRSGNKDVAVTAAHCVWPGQTRAGEQIQVKNLVFVPGYANGNRPHGVYAARAFLLPKSYTEHSSPDVAMVVFDQANGTHLTDAAGSQRITFDRTAAGRTAMFGYPGSKLAHGESLLWCDLDATYKPPTEEWTTLCDMASGASGGPWFADFDARTGTGTIFSVTSRGTVRVDEETGDLMTADLSGPKLDAVARSLHEQAQER
ncbi:trypsin-like serine peptidase [Allokutzneria oryzae]|uniref:Trypsin-like serine peptidase n=1 Tax=Allokutzneria oryzae TaxID=1378989 RepID=A0ABV5ZTX6_9PSEU